MKKIFITFFLLFAHASAIFNPNPLFSATNASINEPNYFEYFWSGNAKELSFNIDLLPGLEFTDPYYQIKMENGRGCEVTYTPLKGHDIFSSKGKQLQEIKVKVGVLNNKNPNEVEYIILVKSYYIGTDSEGFIISETNESMTEGLLTTSSIDIKQNPVFYINNERNKGEIVFNNLLPYSSK